jgi:hypothetical protein
MKVSARIMADKIFEEMSLLFRGKSLLQAKNERGPYKSTRKIPVFLASLLIFGPNSLNLPA